MVLRAAAMLWLLSLSAGNVVRRASSSPSRPSPAPTSFNTSELQCFAKQKVLHPDGMCYALRVQGPCEKGQWLVLDKDQVFVPSAGNRRQLVCNPKPCNLPLRIYWPQDGQCHKGSDKIRLCPFPGNKLSVDSFGEGECACEKTYIRYKPEVLKGGKIVWDGACYPLYQRGPCPVGKILEAEHMEGFGPVGECTDDLCHRENSLASSTWFARSAADGRCYKLGERGACAEKLLFKVNPLTHLVECLPILVEVSSLFNNTERCDGNINLLTDECRKAVAIRGAKFGERLNRARRPRSRQAPATR